MDFPDFTRHFLASQIVLLEFHRRHASGVAVPLYRIVEHFNEIKYLTLGFLSRCIDFSLGNPLFKRSKEAFRSGVVMAVIPTTHGWLEIVISHEGTVNLNETGVINHNDVPVSC